MKLNYISDARADHIAKADGKQTFPWRTVLIARDDMDLLDNDMAQRLARMCDRRHFLDTSRKSGLGLVEYYQSERSRFQGRHEYRHL